MFLVSYIAFLVMVSNFALLVLFVFRKLLIPQFSKYALEIAIVVSTFASLGSLYLSEIVLLPPCDLCWFQRIFMYPIPVILLTAKVRKLSKIWEIVIPLAVIGVLIASYHYILQLFPDLATSCGFSTPCSDTTIKEFGYVTIPWMSLSAFVWVIVFMLIAAKDKKSS